MLDIGAGILAAFSVGIGGLFLYNAVTHHRKRIFLKQTGIVVEGIIMRLEKDGDPESNILYPVVRFTTLNREVITMRYHAGSYPPAFRTGQQVQIMYDPFAPAEFVIGTGSIDWETILFGLLGVSLLGFGFYSCIKPYI